MDYKTLLSIMEKENEIRRKLIENPNISVNTRKMYEIALDTLQAERQLLNWNKK